MFYHKQAFSQGRHSKRLALYQKYTFHLSDITVNTGYVSSCVIDGITPYYSYEVA